VDLERGKGGIKKGKGGAYPRAWRLGGEGVGPLIQMMGLDAVFVRCGGGGLVRGWVGWLKVTAADWEVVSGGWMVADLCKYKGGVSVRGARGWVVVGGSLR